LQIFFFVVRLGGSFGVNEPNFIEGFRLVSDRAYNFRTMLKPLPRQVLKPQFAKETRINPLPQTYGRTVFLGENTYWNLDKVSNPHMVILGTSGSGKTQTLKAIASALFHSFSSRSIILDFHGDQQLPGEIYYSLNMVSPHGINPLIINQDPEGGGSKLQAIAVASNLRRSLVLGVNQEGLLILILDELYREFGIDQSNRQTWNRKPPHFGDLQIAIDNRADAGCADSAKLRIKMAATFQYSVFSKSQVDLDAGKLVRIDLSKLPPELGSIASEALLKQLMDGHRLAGEAKEPKTFVFIDEAKEMRGSRTLDRIAADGRKYGLGVILASQRESHISADILANSATKIVLPVDAADVRRVASRFRFDAGRVASLQTFQALVRMGQEASTCKIQPYYLREKGKG
jgi:type IV secretory pathway VirB4 component